MISIARRAWQKCREFDDSKTGRLVTKILNVVLALLILGLIAIVVGPIHGLTPLPKPPPGVRLEPLLPPLKRAELKPDNAAYYYFQAAEALDRVDSAGPQAKQSRAQSRFGEVSTRSHVDDELLAKLRLREAQEAALMRRDYSVEGQLVQQQLAEYREALDLARRGTHHLNSQMPVMERGLGEPDPRLLRLWKLLTFEARLQEKEGSIEQAVCGYLGNVQFGVHCTKGSGILAHGQGSIIALWATRDLRYLILSGEVPPTSIRMAQQELSRLAKAFQPVGETLRYNLITSKRWVARMQDDWPTGLGRRIIKSTGDRFCEAAYGDLIRECEKPFLESDPKTVLQRWSVPEGETALGLFMLTRSAPRVDVSVVLSLAGDFPDHLAATQAHLEATVVVCGLKRYLLTHGRPPEKLSDLLPQFLEEIPLDPFDGQPLRYQRVSDGWFVWSIGADRKDDFGETGDIVLRSTERDDARTLHSGGGGRGGIR